MLRFPSACYSYFCKYDPSVYREIIKCRQQKKWQGAIMIINSLPCYFGSHSYTERKQTSWPGHQIGHLNFMVSVLNPIPIKYLTAYETYSHGWSQNKHFLKNWFTPSSCSYYFLIKVCRLEECVCETSTKGNINVIIHI